MDSNFSDDKHDNNDDDDDTSGDGSVKNHLSFKGNSNNHWQEMGNGVAYANNQFLATKDTALHVQEMVNEGDTVNVTPGRRTQIILPAMIGIQS